MGIGILIIRMVDNKSPRLVKNTRRPPFSKGVVSAPSRKELLYAPFEKGGRRALARRGDFRDFGFTLIELLIVIIIISIISSVAVISIHTNQKKAYESLANQLANSLRLAEEEAMLNSTTIGLALSKDSYQYFEYQEEKKSWRILPDAALKKHAIPSNIQIVLKMQNKVLELNGKPQIIISASGDMSPFILSIGKIDAAPTYRVIGKANGEVRSEYVEEE